MRVEQRIWDSGSGEHGSGDAGNGDGRVDPVPVDVELGGGDKAHSRTH